MQHRTMGGPVLESERTQKNREAPARLQTHATCKEEELLNEFPGTTLPLLWVLHNNQLNSWHKAVFWEPIKGSQFQAKKRDFQAGGKTSEEVKGKGNRVRRKGRKEETRRWGKKRREKAARKEMMKREKRKENGETWESLSWSGKCVCTKKRTLAQKSCSLCYPLPRWIQAFSKERWRIVGSHMTIFVKACYEFIAQKRQRENWYRISILH